tara:strand:+ start:926 stop:1366 length:441 start_codon:yes stop_codon:yes gene_type:complete
MKLEIIDNSNTLYTFNRSAFLTLASSIGKHEKYEFSYINIIFSKDENMRLLKQKYFNQDYYTDVITFNLEEPNDAIEGEIYIGINQVYQNSIKFNCNLNNELTRIFIHGLLHLVGYDDTTKADKKKMTNLEDKYIALNNDIVLINT